MGVLHKSWSIVQVQEDPFTDLTNCSTILFSCIWYYSKVLYSTLYIADKGHYFVRGKRRFVFVRFRWSAVWYVYTVIYCAEGSVLRILCAAKCDVLERLRKKTTVFVLTFLYAKVSKCIWYHGDMYVHWNSFHWIWLTLFIQKKMTYWVNLN